VTVFDILLGLMLSTCGTKGPVMTTKQNPWMRPFLHPLYTTCKFVWN